MVELRNFIFQAWKMKHLQFRLTSFMESTILAIYIYRVPKMLQARGNVATGFFNSIQLPENFYSILTRISIGSCYFTWI